MTIEDRLPPIRRIAEAGFVAVGAVGAFVLADQAGAQEVRPIPGLESLAPASQQAVVECPLSFADVYEVTQPGSEIVYGHTSLHEGQTLMELSRACLGVTRDTPDPTGSIKQSVAELTQKIQNDNEIVDPAAIQSDTTLAVDITFAASLRATVRPVNSPTTENIKPTTQTGQILAVGVSNTEQPQPPQSLTHAVVRGEWLGLIARNNSTTVDVIVAANPGIDPNLITIGQVLKMPATPAVSVATTENMGPSSGENIHTVINALAEDPTVSYLMSDTGRYMITTKIIQDALSSGVSDPDMISQRIVDAYTAQYQGYINSAHKRPTRDEAIQYLVDIAKLDPAAAAALIDQAAAHPESIDGLGTEALNGNVQRYVAARSTRADGVNKTENMGPGSGPSPEDNFAFVAARLMTPAAKLYVSKFPADARALINTHISSSSVYEIDFMMSQQYEQKIATQVSLGGTDDEILQRLQQIADAPLDPYRSELLAHKLDSVALAFYLSEKAPGYELSVTLATDSRGLLTNLKPATFDPADTLSDSEKIRIAFELVQDDIAHIIQGLRTGSQPPEDASDTYARLVRLVGQQEFDSMLQSVMETPYASNAFAQQIKNVIAEASNRYEYQSFGRLPESERKVMTPDRALEIFRMWNIDPLVEMYLNSHPAEATAYVYDMTIQNQNMNETVLRLAILAEDTLRMDLRAAQTDEERLIAIQNNAGFDIAPYKQSLLNAWNTNGAYNVIVLLTTQAMTYEQVREHVEANEQILALLDPATYREQVDDMSIGHLESVRRTYETIEFRLREGSVQYDEQGKITEENAYAVYRNLSYLIGQADMVHWLEHMKERGIDTHSSDEIVQLIEEAGKKFGPTMNRADHSNDVADNTAGGEGNGVTVQSGDTLTTPIAEPDKRGDNAVDTPPSPYVDPSSFNPDGTPIDNPAAGMGQNTVSPNMAGTPSLSAAVAAHQAAEGVTRPQLSIDEVLKIIQEDGVAIEAINTWYPGGRGPDPMSMYATGEYIRTHQSEIQRKIAEVEAKYSQLPPQEQTQWMLSISNLEYYLNQFNTASTVEDKVAAAIAVAAISAGLGIALS